MDVRKLGPFSRLGDTQVIQIFGFLSVQDRSRLRCTSRRFKALIDHQFSITELLICPDFLKLTNNRWKGTDKLIDYKGLLTSVSFNRDLTVLKLKLRRLKIAFNVPYGLLKTLTQFERLQRLEIYVLEMSEVTEPVRLPQLTYLCVEDVESRQKGCQTIDAPLLKEVSFGNDAINYVLFTDTDQVESLEFALDFHQNSIRFPNLKKIICNRVLDLDLDTLDGLLAGSWLAALFLNVGELVNLSAKLNPESLDSVQYLFEYLIVRQESLRIRNDIKLYIHNVELKPTSSQAKQFEEFGFHCSFSSLFAKNQTREVQTSFCCVDYLQHQAEYLHRLLFAQLETIFKNIQCVLIDCKETLPADEKHFAKFLNRCRALRQLELLSAPFSDDFYESLPSLPSCATLNYLRLFRNQRLDMSFVLKFERLAYLITNLGTNDNLANLLSNLKKKGGYAFYFGCYQTNLVINKKGRNLFDLEIRYPPGQNSVCKYPMQTLAQAIAITRTPLNRLMFTNLEYHEPPSLELLERLLLSVDYEEHRLAEEHRLTVDRAPKVSKAVRDDETARFEPTIELNEEACEDEYVDSSDEMDEEMDEELSDELDDELAFHIDFDFDQ